MPLRLGPEIQALLHSLKPSTHRAGAITAPLTLLPLLRRWSDEATKAGRVIARTVVAFEAGRDGFWLARWLPARGIEAHVIHPDKRCHLP
jgi:hypothetical protein